MAYCLAGPFFKTERGMVTMKDKVVITFSPEEILMLNKIVRNADSRQAMEYLARLNKKADAFLEPK